MRSFVALTADAVIAVLVTAEMVDRTLPSTGGIHVAVRADRRGAFIGGLAVASCFAAFEGRAASAAVVTVRAAGRSGSLQR